MLASSSEISLDLQVVTRLTENKTIKGQDPYEDTKNTTGEFNREGAKCLG